MLKFLAVNFYHKINQYMLERFPVLWNTQFIWTTLLGLLLHALYFGIGYGLLDLDRLKAYSMDSMFFEQVFFWIYLIICLVIFIFMSLRFFGHNPFKHYYPISRFYFWMIFGVLCFYVALFSSVFMSFEQGVAVKSRTLVPEQPFLQDVKTVNLCYPFLFNDINDYFILNRSYPKPFPLDDISAFEITYDTVQNMPVRHGIDRTKPFIELDGMPFQFGHLGYFRPDSCTSSMIIEDIVDVSNTYGLAQYSLYNFNRVLVDYPHPVFFSRYELTKNQIPEHAGMYAYLPEWHKLYQDKNSAAIQSLLTQLEDVCKRYHISYQLNPAAMARDVFLQDLDHKQLIRTGFYDIEQEKPQVSATINKDYERNDKYTERENRDDNYAIDIDKFQHIASNKSELQRMGYQRLQSEEAWVLLFASMCLALILLLFKYLQTKVIIFGIIISGILASLYGIIFFVADKNMTLFNGDDKDRMIWLIAMLVVSVTFCIGVFMIYAKRIKKRYAEFGFISTLFSVIFLPILLALGCLLLTSYHKKEACSNELITCYRFELQPIHFVIMALLSAQLIFMLMRTLHSKME